MLFAFMQDESEGALTDIFLVQKLLDFIKTNKGKAGVEFLTKDYYTRIFDLNNYTKIYVPVKLSNEEEIKVFIDFKVNDGTLDLSRNTNNLYNHVGLSIDLADEYHTGFYINFKSTDNTKLIELWTKTYEEYEAMLDYLGFNISNETGNTYFVNQYKSAITAANNDCNKLDVIFETVPPFVLPELGDDGNWASLSILLNCSKSTWGTDEYQAILNILNGFTIDYLYNKIIDNKKLFRDLLEDVPESSLSEYIYVFSKIGATKWTNQEISSAGSTYAYAFETGGTEEYMSFNPNEVIRLGGAFKQVSDDEITTFEIGRCYNVFSDKYSLVASDQVYKGMQQYSYFSPVTLHVNENYTLNVPAFVAYDVLYRFRDRPLQELASIASMVILPEITLVKFRGLTRIFRAKSAVTVEAKLITEAEIITLQKIKPTGANSSYIGATEIATKAKRITPAANSNVAGRVDDYITTTSTSTRGTIGEEIAETLVRDMDGFTHYPCKLNASDNGFDVIAVKGSLENPIEIRLIESKPMNSGSVSLSTTTSKGTQMSDEWIEATIEQMRNSQDLNLQSIGNMLFKNKNNIQKYITTIDKGSKQIVVIKLDKF